MLKPIRRAVHFDFHNMPGIDNFAEKFDAALFAEQLKEAHVEYVNFFGRCNIGWSYYPTKVGYPYPKLGDKNIFGDVVRECHARGILVSGYLNAGVHHEGLLRHPEWSRVNQRGEIADLDFSKPYSGNFFRMGCYRTGFTDHLLAEIGEILDQGADGIFCDCMLLRPCYCPACVEDMKSRGIDLSDGDAVLKFADELRMETVRRIREAVPEDKYLFLNGIPFHLAAGIATHAEVECLPAVNGQDMFGCFAAWARPLYGNVVYMNGRFQIDWADFGGYKGKAAVENDFFDALMNGAGTCLGDHLHPVGRAEAGIYRDLKEIYGKLRQYDPWTDGAKFVSELAVLSTLPKPRQTHFGVGRILSELKYGYDILMPDGDFGKYPLLILPDDIAVDGALAEKLDAYLKGGGKILSTGSSGLSADGRGFALPQWDFFCDGEDPLQVAYYRYTDPEEELPDLCWECYEPGFLLKKKEGNREFASHVTTYFKPGYNGEHYNFYLPPKGPSGYSVALMNGEKNVIQVSFPLFKAYMRTAAKSHRLLLRRLLAELMPQKRILGDRLPLTSRVTLTEGADYTLLHVKVTYPEIHGNIGIVEEHNVLSAGRTVAVKGRFTEVCLLPDQSPLPFAVKEGYTHVSLPEITGYAMILLK